MQAKRIYVEAYDVKVKGSFSLLAPDIQFKTKRGVFRNMAPSPWFGENLTTSGNRLSSVVDATPQEKSTSSNMRPLLEYERTSVSAEQFLRRTASSDPEAHVYDDYNRWN
jgi:hypothetical protein